VPDPADPVSFLRDTDPSNTQGNFTYALFTDLIPSASGVLAFAYTGNTGDGGSIAGYQLVEHVVSRALFIIVR
jgi:hypothetical protein